MCGIVGVVGNLNLHTSLAFRNMLWFDQIRGIDSTGVIYVPMNQKFDIKTEKEIGGPNNLWEYNDSEIFNDRGMIKNIGRTYIGHNRHKTSGGVSKETAHPFTYNNVIGVHNGTLKDYDDIKHGEKFKVDSQYLLNSIDKIGIKDTWASFRGAATVCWWDKEKDTINFIRNEQRPMFFAENKSKNMFMFASETWMIKQAAKISKINIEEPIELPVHTHTSFKPSATNYEMVERTKIEPKPKVYAGARVVGGNRNNLIPFGYAHGYHGANKKDKSINNNQSLLSILPKADKKYRGKIVKIVGMSGFDNVKKDTDCYLVGEYESGNNIIRIYPQTHNEYNRCKQIAIGSRHKISCRPRERKNTNGTQAYLAVSSVNTKPVFVAGKTYLYTAQRDAKPSPLKFVKGPKGNLITQEEWRKLTNNLITKGCCDFCSEPLLLEEANDIEWYGNKTAIHKHCTLDEAYANMMGHADPSFIFH